MDKVTIFIYRYFKAHKIVFYSILLMTTLFFAFFTSKINFEEDVTTLLPSMDGGGAEKLVFSNLKVKDKIFILFNAKSDSIGADRLIEECDRFVQSLAEKDTVYNAINNVLYKISEDLFLDAISFLYNNVPVYLDSSAYGQLDSILGKEPLEEQMKENYSLLRSPAGMLYRHIIPQDPVALRKIFLSEVSGMKNGLGGNFTFYNNHIFTADTTVAIAFLSPNFKSFDSKQSIRLAEMIEKEISLSQKENPDIEILYHGAPVQSVYNSKQIKKDLAVTISISLVIILLILLVCFRNKSTLLYLLLPVIYGVLFSLATIYLIKGSMSLMALGIGAIVMGVAFSYCLHIITHYKYVNDPEIVLRDQAKPITLGALTTIGPFMGLMLTQSELLHDFGLFASLGLVGTIVFGMFFLPQFFIPEKNRKSEKAFAFLERINSFPFEKQKWLLILIGIVSIICFMFSGKVEFDSDLRNIGYNEPKIMDSNKLLASKTTQGFATVYFASVSDNLDSALIINRQLSAKLDELVENGQIKGYAAPASLFIPTGEQQRRIDQWNAYWTEEKKEQVKKDVVEAGSKHRLSDKLFAPFFKALDTEYKPVSLYESGVIPEGIMSNILEHTDDRYMVFIPVQMDRQKLLETGHLIVGTNPNFVVVDPMYYTSDMVRMMHDDFDTTLAISSLFVLVMLLIFYRNIPLTLIAFLPMGLSWYIVLGAMSLLGLQFNLINIVIAAFIFGIGVDYSIYVMDGLLGKERAYTTLLMYHKTAIFLSAVILIIVTSSLLFAVHPAIKSIGIATLIGMGAVIVISYSLLPFLYSLLVKYRNKRKKAVNTGN